LLTIIEMGQPLSAADKERIAAHFQAQLIPSDAPPANDGVLCVLPLIPSTVVLGRSSTVTAYTKMAKGQPSQTANANWSRVEQKPFALAINCELYRAACKEIPEDGPFGKALAPLWKVPRTIFGGVVEDGEVRAELIAQCADAEGAKTVMGTAKAALTLFTMANAERQANAANEEAQPFKVFSVLLKQLHKNSDFKVDGTNAVATTKIDPRSIDGAALSKYLPDVAAATVSARDAGRAVTRAWHLRQIMIAMLKYEQKYGHLPPPVVFGKDGKGGPAHSWRVELLPFLEQQALYDAYHFDEPWDSAHNKTLLAKIPPMYVDPTAADGSTFSAYYVLVGSQEEIAANAMTTIFTARDGARLGDIADGVSNTIAVVEAKREIPWTKPDDILYSPKKPLPKLGGFSTRGFYIGLCDGSVHRVDDKLGKATLRALISPNGGEIVPQIFTRSR
jgi:hypothetical protein